MYPESDDLNEYLVSDAIVDWQTPAVRQKALELAGALADEVAKARCLYEWVRDSISHSDDAGLEMVTCTASEVLHYGTGSVLPKATFWLPCSGRSVSRPVSATRFYAWIPRSITSRFCTALMRSTSHHSTDGFGLMRGATPTGSMPSSA